MRRSDARDQDTISFQSDPPGAAVKTVALRTPCGPRFCTPNEGPYNPGPIEAPQEWPGCAATPCSIKVSRAAEMLVEFSLPGYQPIKARVETQMGGGGAARIAGNVLFVGGAVGTAIISRRARSLTTAPTR